MSYSIDVAGNLVIVHDGEIDQTATDLTLIGRNYTGFGEHLNENFIKVLENFSSSLTAPTYPITGQLWYDTNESKLKVYNKTAFVPVSSTTIAEQQPLNMGVGDMWYNTVTKQLNFWNGSSIILIGPSYTTSQGKSGIVVLTVPGTDNVNHTITCLYNNEILLGLFATETFTLVNPIIGYSPDKEVKIGFNQGTLANFRFNVTAIDSDKLAGNAETIYLRTGRDGYLDHKLYIDSFDGLSVKTGTLKVDSTNNLVLENTVSNQPITFRGKYSNTTDDSLTISPGSRTIEIGSSDTPYQLNLYQAPSQSYSVTNKYYVDQQILKNTMMFSLVTDGTVTDARLLQIVQGMAPAYEHPIGTFFKLLCSPQNPSSPKQLRFYKVVDAGGTNTWQLQPLLTTTI